MNLQLELDPQKKELMNSIELSKTMNCKLFQLPLSMMSKLDRMVFAATCIQATIKLDFSRDQMKREKPKSEEGPQTDIRSLISMHQDPHARQSPHQRKIVTITRK